MIEGSSGVFVNGKLACRIGDKDSRGDSIRETGATTTSVYIDGKKAARIGDIDTGKDKKIEGAEDVIIGD